MGEVVDDSVNYPSLPSNYISIVHLQQRWLKEKQRKQQENEQKKQYPHPQNDKKHIAKSWCEGTRGKNKEKKKMGYFVKKVEREMIGNGGKELCKGKCKVVEEQVGGVCMGEVVGERDVERGSEGERCGVEGFKGKKYSRRGIGDGVWVGEVSEKGDSNGEKEKEKVDVNERINEKVKMRDAFCAYGDKEVASVCNLEVVGENKGGRGIAGEKCGVGFRGKKYSRREMGGGVGEVSDKGDSVEQSGRERNGGKEKVSVDVKERNDEKVNVRGAFCEYGDKEVEEVATVCRVEVVGESNVDKGIAGKRCGVGFRGKKHSGRKMGDGVGEMSDKADSEEQSGLERNAEKEKVSVDVKERTDEKVKVSRAFRAYGDKEVASVCTMEIVGDREIAGLECGVGYKGKKNRRRRMSDGVGQLSDKMDSGEQSGKRHNTDKEEVSVDVKGRNNEKVKVSGAFRGYGDKEVEEVATVCMVEVVGENKLDRKIAGQKCRVAFRGTKNGWRRMGDGVGQVSDRADKAESVEQSGQEHNAEKEEVSVDVKERTNEKVRVRGAFRAYDDKSIDVPLIDSEAGLKMKIERDLGDLSLSNRRYGHGRSIFGVHDGKLRYGNSRRYEPRKTLKQRDSSFVWIKKGESSNANVAEIETQVDFSGQSIGGSKLFSQ